MFPSNVMAFLNRLVTCDRPKRGSAFIKKKKLQKDVLLSWLVSLLGGDRDGYKGHLVSSGALCFYQAEIGLKEVDLILQGLQLLNAYQNVFLSYII